MNKIFKKHQIIRVPVLVLVLVFITVTEGIDTKQLKAKRQIYREQVLPSKGGKIPEEAFRTDRLALNRLNKEGISVPDGVLLEHRLVHSHPHINKHDPEDEAAVIKIVQKDDNRFVAAPGKFHHQNPLTIPSTYIIRKPIGPVSAVLKVPAHHMSNFILRRPFQNQPNFNSFAQNEYQYQQKFIPQIPSYFPRTPQKFPHSDINSNKYKAIEFPNKKYLPSDPSFTKNHPSGYVLPPKKYISQSYNPTVIHHPHPHGYDPPVSYQSVSYFPVTSPLILPSREVYASDFYQVKDKAHTNNSPDVYSNDIHDAIDWPALLAHYTQVSNNLDALNRDANDKVTPHQELLTPEVIVPK